MLNSEVQLISVLHHLELNVTYAIQFPIMLNEFISGGVAGCVSIVAGQPFDTIKVRLQTSSQYTGPWHCLTDILKCEGYAGLFRGLMPPLVTATASNAIIFLCHNHTLGIIRSDSQQDHKYTDLFLSGSACGLISSVIQCPTELIKIRLQLYSRDAFSGTWDCLLKTYKLGGIPGLFQGMNTTLGREVPAFGMYFYSQKIAEDYLNTFHLNPYLSSCIAGGFAGTCSWSCTYPIDLAKTEIQMAAYQSSKKHRSFVNVIRRIIKNHGVSYLYRGLGTTIFRSLPVNAVLFPVYKFCSEFLRKNGY